MTEIVSHVGCVSDWIMTYTGRCFSPLAPRVEDVCLDDIAHALAATSRFGGHTRKPYSVAQHSVILSLACGKEDAIYGLLHDATEAYLVDVPSPLKRTPTFAAYRLAEEQLHRVILEAFDLNPAHDHRAIKVLDRRMLRTEQRDLMPPPAPGEGRDDVPPFKAVVEPWSFHRAKWAFLTQFARLTGAPAPSLQKVIA